MFPLSRFIILSLFLIPAALSADGEENRYGRFRDAQPGRFISLVRPEYLSAAEAQLTDDAVVLGVAVGEDARCYPLRQLWYHHVVNDEIGGQKLAVTYCVMANTGITYRLEDVERDALEVGGLYGGVLALKRVKGPGNWAQIADVEVPARPTSGPLTLGPEPQITTWKNWKSRHPRTKVLKPVSRFSLSYEAYDRRPRGYNANPLMNDTVIHHDSRLQPGDEVYGVASAGKAKAWLLKDLERAGVIEDRLGTAPVTIRWDKELKTPFLEKAPPEPAFRTRSFWYAWSSFYPETELGGLP